MPDPQIIGYLLTADLTYKGTSYRSGTIVTDPTLSAEMLAAGLPMFDVTDDDPELQAVLASMASARGQNAAGGDLAQFILPLIKKTFDDVFDTIRGRLGFFNFVGNFNQQAEVGVNAVQTQAGQPLAIHLPVPPADAGQILGTRVTLLRVAYDGGPSVSVDSPSGQPIGFAGDVTGPSFDASGYSSLELVFSIAPGHVAPPSFYWHVVSVVPFPT